MKAIMYHYVRNDDVGSPYFIYLHVSDFEKQLNFLMENFYVLNYEEILDCFINKKIIDNGVVLTFDDGLKDHYQYVYPLLKDRGISGIFYVSSLPFVNEKLLDVHRIHYLLGRFGGSKVLDAVRSLLTPEIFIASRMKNYEQNTYQKQTLDDSSRRFKQLLNYCIKPEIKTNILDRLISFFDLNEALIAKQFYLSKDEMLEMHKNKMVFGSHSHSHTLLSNLNASSQDFEISKSLQILEEILQARIDTFCYPYGGEYSYNEHTLSSLLNNKIDYAFSVESRDITIGDLEDGYEIPRYDCNEFPFGKARGV